MKPLNEHRLKELRRYLEKCGTEAGLIPELLDHLACEAEERLWEGVSFEQVLLDLSQEASPGTLNRLQMERKHILAADASLTDIVFENRNRLYGAYVLRRDYRSTVQRATLIGVTLFLMIFLLPTLYNTFFVTPPPVSVEQLILDVSKTSIRIPAVP